MSGKKPELNYEEVKQKARDSKTVTAFCTAMGISTASFYNYKRDDERFRQAYEEGSDTGKYAPEDFYKWGKEHLSHPEIAARYSTSVIRVSQILKDKKFKEAYEKGKAGLELTDEFSQVDILRKNSGASVTDFEPGQVSQNSKLGQTHTNIVEAVRLQYRTVQDIARFTGEDATTVYNALAHLVTEGKMRKSNIEGSDFAQYYLPEEAGGNRSRTGTGKEGAKEEISARNLILKAIDDGHYLMRGIITATGLDGMIVADELEDMEGFDVEFKYAGSTRCYFRIDQVPEGRLVLDGAGGVRIIAAEKPKFEPTQHALEMLKKTPVRSPETEPEGNSGVEDKTDGDGTTKSDELSDQEWRELNDPLLPDYGEDADDDKIETAENPAIEEPLPVAKTEFDHPPSPNRTKNTVRKNIDWTEAMFEEFGREGLSKIAIGKRLGVSEGSVHYQLKKEKFSSAYDLGWNSIFVAKPEPAPVLKVKETQTPPEIPEELQTAEPSQSKSLEETQPIETPNAAKSEPEGIVKVDPRFRSLVEHLKRSERSGGLIRQREAEISEKAEPLVTRPTFAQNWEIPTEDESAGSRVVVVGVDSGQTTTREMARRIALEKGSFVIASDANIFDFNKRERKFLDRLMDVIEEFEEGGGGQ